MKKLVPPRPRSWLAVLVSLATVGGSVGASLPASAVAYGGSVAAPQSAVPWVVSLYQSPPDSGDPVPDDLVCTGTALDAHTVLTAAHCLEELGKDVLSVGYGSARLRGQTITPVAAMRDHPRYDTVEVFNDLAVLRTRESMRIRWFPQLATKSHATVARRSSTSLTIYGWGVDQRGRLTGRLSKASLKPKTSVAKRYWGSGFRPNQQLAAGAASAGSRHFKGACEGDSGGPLVLYSGRRSVVVGVTSFGSGKCGSRSPTIFMSIGDYRGWIGSVASHLAAHK